MLTITIDLNDSKHTFTCESAILGTRKEPGKRQVEFLDSNLNLIHSPQKAGIVYVMNENGKTVATYHLDVLNNN